MRIIPGNTKVKIEIFKGITLWDLLVGALAAIMLTLIMVSTLPYKYVFAGVHVFIAILLLVRLDKEPNYLYLLHIIRHFGFNRRYARTDKDEVLFDIAKRGENEVAFDEIFKEEKPAEEEPEETAAERKERLKREKEEYKNDTKLLKSKTLTKEEEDAIWLKRANQSKANKDRKKASSKKKKKVNWAEMDELSSFTGIKNGFIEYGKSYYGAVLEMDSVEFRFFSEFRKTNTIERGLGSVLRAIKPDYSANIIKIERPVSYADHLETETKKLDSQRLAFENGLINEEELKSRIAIIYDRIYELQAFKDQTQILVPFYYIALYDSDRQQLENSMRVAIDNLRLGEMKAKRLNDKELAVFLKYTNQIDFDETDIEKVRPEDYAKWAMPEKVEFTMRHALINGMVTHNFRVNSYPTVVGNAWLASLMTYPATKVIVKIKPMDSGKAITAIDKSLAELRATVASAKTDSEAMEAQTHLETLQMLLSSLQGDNETLLNTNVYVTAYDCVHTDENPKYENLKYETMRVRVANMKKTMRRIWSEAGFRLNNMEFNQALAYLGSQVSGYDPMEKDGRGIPSNTVAATYPWVFPFVMDKNGFKLGTNEGVPVFVDFFVRNSERVNSNMVIVGKSGSGKSYATKSILTNLAADGAKIFILDPEDEYTDLSRNLNGKFINVANAQYGRLNPFHIITNLDDDEDTSEDSAGNSYSTHLQFLEEFFKQILPDCDRDSLEYLNAMIDRVYAAKGISAYSDFSKLKPEDYPIFDDLYDEILKEFQRVDSEYIRGLLRTLMNYISKFSDGGRNASIWNGPSSVTTEENFTVFNFQTLLANRNTTVANAQMLLVLKYIDNEIIKNRDYNEKYGLHRKIVVVIDEAHVFIDTKYPVALDFMFQLAKRIRKYNGMQIVITQNIKDFVGTEEIARKSTAIINACQYSFIFALAPNDMEDLCKLYEKAGGINENEQDMIVQAPRGTAFVIMSPHSRTNMNVSVPADIKDLFSNPSYINKYFEGEGGDENWADYIGDSKEKRAEILLARGIAAEEENEEESSSEGFTHVGLSFNEVSFDEYSEKAAEEERAKEERIAASEIKLSEAAFVPETADINESLSPATRVIIPTPVEIPQGPSKTEEMLAELALKLGSENIENKVKIAVREELDKEIAARPIVPAAAPAAEVSAPAPAPAPEEEESGVFDFGSILSAEESEEKEPEAPVGDSGGALGNIFDFAGISDMSVINDDELDATIEENANAHEDDDFSDLAADDDDEFDVMAFLAQQASSVETEINDSSIADFINSSETVLSVSLEQLIAYNKNKK